MRLWMGGSKVWEGVLVKGRVKVCMMAWRSDNVNTRRCARVRASGLDVMGDLEKEGWRKRRINKRWVRPAASTVAVLLFLAFAGCEAGACDGGGADGSGTCKWHCA